MPFSCSNEVLVSGGDPADRRRALAMLAAADWGLEPVAAEDAEAVSGLTDRLRFGSLDAIPEDEIRNIAPQFPDLDFLLLYLSIDGEFFGFLRIRGTDAVEESADFPDGDGPEIERIEEAQPLGQVRRFYAGNPALLLP